MSQLLSQGPIFLLSLIFLLGIVVIVHELGHYWMGRVFGAAADSFSVGFGKPLYERKDSRGTRWRINWIPFGGFVKFVGEAQLAGDVGKQEQGLVGKAYTDLGPGKRSLVAIAGPLANFVLAAVIYAILLMAHGKPLQQITVQEVSVGQAAEAGGLLAGDIIKTIDDRVMRNTDEMTSEIILNVGTPLVFGVERAGEPVDLTITPVEIVRENAFGQMQAMGTVGMTFSPVETSRIKYGPFKALAGGVAQTGTSLQQTTTLLTRIVTGKMSVHTMTGPVGVGDISRRAVNQIWSMEGKSSSEKWLLLFWYQLSICAAVSVGIGFFNLLPLPILDGGHVIFNAYEAVAGKTLPEKVQEMSLTIGLVLLLGMVVVITWGDIIETGVFRGSGS